jgi:hypothetical protein
VQVLFSLAGGPTDIEIVDYPRILTANALIDVDDLGVPRLVEGRLTLMRRARGIADGHTGRLWAQNLAGQRGGPAWPMWATGTPGPISPRSGCWRCVRRSMGLDLLPAIELVVAVASGKRGPD